MTNRRVPVKKPTLLRRFRWRTERRIGRKARSVGRCHSSGGAERESGGGGRGPLSTGQRKRDVQRQDPSPGDNGRRAQIAADNLIPAVRESLRQNRPEGKESGKRRMSLMLRSSGGPVLKLRVGDRRLTFPEKWPWAIRSFLRMTCDMKVANVDEVVHSATFELGPKLGELDEEQDFAFERFLGWCGHSLEVTCAASGYPPTVRLRRQS
jgi:hypothetical protein